MSEPTFADAARAGAAVAGRGLLVKAGAIGLVVLVLLVILLGAIGGSSTPLGAQANAADGCVALGPDVSGISPTEEAEQIAAIADDVATELNMPGRAVLIILMTGWQESTMSNLDYGDRDSLGWLQQRPSQGWGTPAQVRDPAHASRRFYQALRNVSGWVEMAPGDAAQAVQRSAYPDAYAKWEAEAEQLAERVGADLTRPGDAYGTGQSDVVDAGGAASDILGCGSGPVDGNWPAEDATICPDPTNGLGCITPRTLDLVNAIKSSGLEYPRISCWDPHAWNPKSDHATGKACDIPFSSGFPNAQEKAAGDAMAAWAVEQAGELGVHYVIWAGQEWQASEGRWKPYDGAGGLYDPTTPSGGHFDHVHISMY